MYFLNNSHQKRIIIITFFLSRYSRDVENDPQKAETKL